jgi:uncharacterized membrane protein
MQPLTVPPEPAPNGLSGAPAPVVGATRVVALCTAVALVAVGLAWELWLAPTGRGTLAWKVLPMALALPGLARGRLYTFRWLSLLVWLYAAEGAVRATSEANPTGRALAAVEVLLAIVLFAACAWHVRAALAAGRAQR